MWMTVGSTMWEDFKGGKGSEKCSNYILITKFKKQNNLSWRLVHKTRALMVLFTNWIRIAAIIRLNARYKGQKDPNIHSTSWEIENSIHLETRILPFIKFTQLQLCVHCMSPLYFESNYFITVFMFSG